MNKQLEIFWQLNFSYNDAKTGGSLWGHINSLYFGNATGGLEKITASQSPWSVTLSLIVYIIKLNQTINFYIHNLNQSSQINQIIVLYLDRIAILVIWRVKVTSFLPIQVCLEISSTFCIHVVEGSPSRQMKLASALV